MNTVLLHGRRPRNDGASAITLQFGSRDARTSLGGTIAAPPMCLGETIAVSESEARLAARAPDVAPSRATVLPRLESHGAVPRLVSQGKLRYEHRRRLGEGGLGEVIGARDN